MEKSLCPDCQTNVFVINGFNNNIKHTFISVGFMLYVCSHSKCMTSFILRNLVATSGIVYHIDVPVILYIWIAFVR